jgi:signal transduction histidine kinase
MRFWPRSLRTRTVVVVSATLLASHIAGLAIYFAYNASSLTQAREQRSAEQIAIIARLLERIPEERHDEIIGQLSRKGFRLSLDPEPRVKPEEAGDADTESLRNLLHLALGSPIEESILADYGELIGDDDADWADDDPDAAERQILANRVGKFGRFRENLVVSLRVDDKHWLNARISGYPYGELFNLGLLSSLAVMVVAALALAAWVTDRPLAALSALTRGAEALGVNVASAKPLREKGPTELRRASEAFNRMQRRIQALVDERTRMVAAISHDLRTPLARIRLRAEFADDPAEREKMQGDIAEMESMIDDTLKATADASASEERMEVDFVSLITRLTLDLGVEPPSFQLDGAGEIRYRCAPGAIRRACMNLINNAVLYGGTARVSVARFPGEIRVDVEDDGPGIPPIERANVFLPFYRLEPSRSRHTGGTGLGLTIAQAIVRAHGGEVTLGEAPGGGLLARITLPTSEPPADADAE